MCWRIIKVIVSGWIAITIIYFTLSPSKNKRVNICGILLWATSSFRNGNYGFKLNSADRRSSKVGEKGNAKVCNAHLEY